MCMDGVCHMLIENEKVRELMLNPGLDIVHKQVVMTLYALDAGGRLTDYREVLPVYLSRDWAQCSDILITIEEAGLLRFTPDGIALTHPIAPRDPTSSCACGR